MNLVDCVVTKVIKEPYKRNNVWYVEVEYDCYGHKDKTTLMFNSEKKAICVKKGYKFTA